AVIEKGKILAKGTVQEILNGLRRHRILSVRVARQTNEVERFLLEQPGVLKVRESNGGLEFDFTGNDEEQVALLNRLVSAGFPVLEFSAHDAGLEDLFMKITTGSVQ